MVILQKLKAGIKQFGISFNTEDDSLSDDFSHSESDSSLDYDEEHSKSAQVNNWMKFEILKILPNRSAISAGLKPRIGGFYRCTKEFKNGLPVWRNRFSYEISKPRSDMTVFDVYLPNEATEMRIEEDSYNLWIRKGDQFHPVLDNSVQFFFDYAHEAGAHLDHFIESYVQTESKRHRVSNGPRALSDLKWSRGISSNSSLETAKDQEEKLPPVISCSLPGKKTPFRRSFTTDRSLLQSQQGESEPHILRHPMAMDSEESSEAQSLPRGLLGPIFMRAQSFAMETTEITRKRRGQRIFINQYMVESTLANTGQGKVRLATDIINKKKVVLKIFERSLLTKQDRISRSFRKKRKSWLVKKKKKKTALDKIKQEMEIMRNLQHPNIVSALEIIDDNRSDEIFLVLEYVEGGKLTSYLSRREGNSLELCRSFIRDVFHGLEYLHGKRVIHGDIKPDNILIKIHPGGRKQLKLADFGVSKTISEFNSYMSRIETTPAYQAPEELQNSNFKAWPRDIWAVGVVLHQLVFGAHPFTPCKTAALHETYDRIRTFEIELPPTCDADLGDLLCQMLKKDPALRITLDGIKAHVWITDHDTFRWSDQVPQIAEDENEIDLTVDCENVVSRRLRLKNKSKDALIDLIFNLESLVRSPAIE